MMRIILWVFMISLFSVVETSFFHSLPGWLTLTPFVLGVCVYFVQHQGVHAFIWWLPLHGLFLSSLSAGFTSMEVLPYCVSALLISVSAKHLFSNRSYYGVLSCALVGFAGIVFTESLILLFSQLSHVQVHWITFLRQSLIRLLLLFMLLTAIYPFAKRIRSFLVSFSLLPEPRKTY